MGKLTDDKIKLSIEINGSQARNELGKVEKEAIGLSKSYKELLLQKKNLSKTDKDYVSNLNSLNKKIVETKMAIDKNTIAQKELRKEIGLTGMTMNQLNKEAMKLRAMKANLTPGTEQFKKINAELEATNAQIRELKGNTQAKGGQGMFGKMADSFNKFQGIALAATAAFTGLGLALANIVSGNAEMSDSLSDVQKTTGLTEKEVKELNRELKNIDTRSSRKELLDLAYIAGKLGITGKADVLGFVRAADQIGVALGADLGGNVEDAVNSLGKLTQLFGLKEAYGLEQSLLKTGSAINALGAASTASETYLVNFSRRMGGVGKTADVSLQDILGYGAALDQLGQTAEVSTTTLSKVWVNMFKDPGEYAKIAGMEIGEFAKLLKTDANEAFLKFLEGLNGNNDGLGVMAQKMEALKLDGARSVGVLTALAGNIQLVREQQTVSNTEFEKGTSLTDEFNVKNNNLAGTLEKLGKKFRSLFINPELNEALINITNSLYKWIAIPVSATMEQQRIKVNALTIELTNANVEEERKKKIWEELRTIAPGILKDLQLENINTANLITNLRLYNEEAIKKIAVQRAQEDLTEIQEKVGKQTEKRAEAEMKLNTALQKQIKLIASKDEALGAQAEATLFDPNLTALDKFNKIHEMTIGMRNEFGNVAIDFSSLNVAGAEYTYQLKEENKLLAEADTILARYNEKYKAIMGMTQPVPVATGGGEESGSLAETIIPDADGKKSKGKSDAEIAAEKMAEYRKAILLASKSLIDQETAAYEERLRQAGIFGKKQEDMTAEDLEIQKILHETYLLNVSKINNDAFQKEITVLQSNFENEQTRRQTAYQQQLTLIGDNETEKAALKKWYDKQTEDATREHLTNLLTILEQELPSAESFNLDLETAILTDEQKDALLKKIEEVKLALAGLNKPADKPAEDKPIEIGIKTDIFGMSAEDWANMLTNLAAGKFELNEMLNLAQAMTNAFAMINEVRANMEERGLQKFEENIDYRKQVLDNLLKHNRISQERYNKDVAKLDAELDKEKRKIAHDQAVRAKETAIFSAIINTATAVISALATPPPWLGIALAVLIGGMGALQIATIASEPIPQAASGRYDVIGKQDGKKYSGPVIDSPPTGLINSPAILVGEKPELIVDPATTKNLMVNYPNVIDAINRARVPQFASGDYTNIQGAGSDQTQQQIAAILAAQTMTMDRLNKNLESGIQAKLLADDEYVRTNKDVNSRYDKLTSHAGSSL